jgi:hypothetical protein
VRTGKCLVQGCGPENLISKCTALLPLQRQSLRRRYLAKPKRERSELVRNGTDDAMKSSGDWHIQFWLWRGTRATLVSQTTLGPSGAPWRSDLCGNIYHVVAPTVPAPRRGSRRGHDVINFNMGRSSRGPRKAPRPLIKPGSTIKQPRVASPMQCSRRGAMLRAIPPRSKIRRTTSRRV